MFIGHSDEGMRDFNLKHGASRRNVLVERKFHILRGHHHLSWRGCSELTTPDHKRGKLSRSVARAVLPDLRIVVQDDVQQGILDFQFSIVFAARGVFSIG
jgi:hypothetical protein